MGVVLKNDNQEIELYIKGYEVTVATKSYWDNNWLVLSCWLTEGGKSVYGEFPCFMAMELYAVYPWTKTETTNVK